MNHKRLFSIGINQLNNINRNLKDCFGSIISSYHYINSCNSISKCDLNSLKHVLLIYRESFGGNAGKKIKKYCKLFNHTFYILKYDGDVVGYCIYYIHIKLENLKLIKKATLYSIAITHKERKKGFAKILLKESINELKFNNISKIALYVDCKNQAAINLYKSYGFIIIGETENICGLKKNCYLMELCFKD